MEILREYNGIQIPQREDGYISLTKMAQAVNKQASDFTRLKSTDEFLIALENKRGIPRALAIQVIQDGNTTGTYAHPKVAIQLLQIVEKTEIGLLSLIT